MTCMATRTSSPSPTLALSSISSLSKMHIRKYGEQGIPTNTPSHFTSSCVDNYKPIPYTGISVEQTIMHIEETTSDNIPWYGSCNAATRDGFMTKISRYDVHNALLAPTLQHPTQAKYAFIKFCDMQPVCYHLLVASNKQSRRTVQEADRSHCRIYN